ncbi:hypothetical protein DVH24_025164 [Malus domestica]|uniref:Secreted protein n=1 Tax=Malus domestica TaxID=3750 RepID=A0A498HS34_MALDO|nr:hypothetical protein DVH24_025164 [Malus domestica]
MIEILLLPLAVIVAALNVGDEGVERDRVVVVECRSEGTPRHMKDHIDSISELDLVSCGTSMVIPVESLGLRIWPQNKVMVVPLLCLTQLCLELFSL